MNYKRYLLVAVLLCLSLLLFGKLDSTVSFAQSPEPSPAAVKYAEAYRVSEDEATRRLSLQEEMGELAKRVADGESTYAGSWIQHEPDFRLFVNFTAADEEAKLAPYLDDIPWRDSVEARQATRTIADLLEILQVINDARDKIDLPFESGTNYETNKVRLYTPNPDELQKMIEAHPDWVSMPMLWNIFFRKRCLNLPR